MQELVNNCIDAVQAEIDAAFKDGNSERRIKVYNGQFQREACEAYVYKFSVSRELPVNYDDAPIRLYVSGNDVGGEVIGIGEFEVTLALRDYLGKYVAEAELVVDLTFILRKLKALLESRRQTLPGSDLCRKAMGFDEAVIREIEPENPHESQQSLNPAQATALRKCLGSDFLMVWGPPGTGKTHVLGRLLREEMLAGRSAILMSNTNVAVDHALTKFLELCRTDERLRSLLEQGKFVRLGTPQIEDVDCLVVDRITERLSRKLMETLRQKQGRYQEITARLKPLEEQVASYRLLLETQARLDRLDQELATAKDQLAQAENKKQQVSAELSNTQLQINSTLQKRGIAGAFARLMLPSAQNRCSKLSRELSSISLHADQRRQQVSRIEESRRSTQAELQTLSRGKDDPASWSARLLELERETHALGSEAKKLQDEINELNAELAAVRDRIIRNAQLIACTCAKSTLDVNVSSRRFSSVLLDECSMVSVPQALWCSSLAERKMICFGDFRQLPPISRIDEQELPQFHRIMAQSVFEQNRIGLDGSSQDPRLHMLEEQYRMPSQICDLVSGPMYDGRLRTHASVRAADNPVTLVSTSEFNAWSDKTQGWSWFNWHHAFATVELLRQLASAESQESEPEAPVLILSPYRAQVELISALLKEAGLERRARVSTVWRAQGREAPVVIIDTVCAPPFSKPGRWFLQPAPSSEGARLLNVAVTRAMEQLYIIAHDDYLSLRCESTSLAASLLDKARRAGSRINSVDLVRTSVCESADETGGHRILTFEPGVAAVYDACGFNEAFAADLESLPAGSTVTIFSPFLSEKSIAAWGPRLRTTIERGCRVEIFTRAPDRDSFGADPIDVCRLIDELKSLGAVVGFDRYLPGQRPMHHKIAILQFPDNSIPPIIWKGSMNVLGHYGSEELMDRSQSQKLFGCVASLIRLEELRSLGRGQELKNAVEDQLRRMLKGECPVHQVPMDLRLSTNDGRKSYFLGCPKWASHRCEKTVHVSAEDLDRALSIMDARCTEINCDARIAARRGRNGVYLKCEAGHFVTLVPRALRTQDSRLAN